MESASFVRYQFLEIKPSLWKIAELNSIDFVISEHTRFQLVTDPLIGA